MNQWPHKVLLSLGVSENKKRNVVSFMSRDWVTGDDSALSKAQAQGCLSASSRAVSRDHLTSRVHEA